MLSVKGFRSLHKRDTGYLSADCTMARCEGVHCNRRRRAHLGVRMSKKAVPSKQREREFVDLFRISRALVLSMSHFKLSSHRNRG
uniref:Uncharacterized protein n=1 Tax=Physcomitrium patens TaxID=3218 RepID=A0A2K1IPC4_PHYPA|nr:hypothetical protein PHYPA_027446 [Physcomitrium patens]